MPVPGCTTNHKFPLKQQNREQRARRQNVSSIQTLMTGIPKRGQRDEFAAKCPIRKQSRKHHNKSSQHNLGHCYVVCFPKETQQNVQFCWIFSRAPRREAERAELMTTAIDEKSHTVSEFVVKETRKCVLFTIRWLSVRLVVSDYHWGPIYTKGIAT